MKVEPFYSQLDLVRDKTVMRKLLLDDDHGKEKNIFGKTEKFVSVSQLAGEDDRDYFVRAVVMLVLTMQMH